MSKNSVELPEDLPADIRRAQLEVLANLGVDPNHHHAIAKAIMTMSDFYAKHPEKSSPWEHTWAQIAYVAYYMPLNWWRLCGVLARGQQLKFFDGFEHYVDFGSGLGSLGFAFDYHGLVFGSGQCLERSSEAISIHRQLAKRSGTSIEWIRSGLPKYLKPRTLAVFSYSLTELDSLPDWVKECEGILIVEPSTKSDSRRLQTLRSQLLAQGWYVWGPCTHSGGCPLLIHSERDWCHDRFQWTQPNWLKEIENQMPIKNGTLPCAWLMMRRDPPVESSRLRGRMTGDLQEFKGYAKQLICRGEEREFLAWQKKDFKKSYPQFGRGDLVMLAESIANKGDELRPKTASDVTLMGEVEMSRG